jgi:tRNA G18 (ribose-2'-O)-methylase SpoU
MRHRRAHPDAMNVATAGGVVMYELLRKFRELAAAR